MIRRSLNLSRMKSALNRSIAWQAEKNAAPRPAIAASFGASARRSSVDQSNAAVSAAIETPMTIPSPIRAGAKERPRAATAARPARGSASIAGGAAIGETGRGEAERGDDARPPRAPRSRRSGCRESRRSPCQPRPPHAGARGSACRGAVRSARPRRSSSRRPRRREARPNQNPADRQRGRRVQERAEGGAESDRADAPGPFVRRSDAPARRRPTSR